MSVFTSAGQGSMRRTVLSFLALVILLVLAVQALAQPGPVGERISSPFVVQSPPQRAAMTAEDIVSPAGVIRAYYNAINRGDYFGAYHDLALPGRPPFSTWVREYRDTTRVTIDRLAVPAYRIDENGSRYTCMGISMVAHQMGGQTSTWGGWYLTAQTGQRWSLILLGSRIRKNARLRVPSWRTCLSQVPPAQFLGLTALYFRDVNHGWAAGLSLTQTYLLRTSDGGESWQRFGIPAAVAELDFVDNLHGWELGLVPAGCLWYSGPPLICRQVLLATRDGGKTWRQELSEGNGASFPQESLTLQFLDWRHGWLISNQARSRLLATSDGGISWRPIFSSSLQLTSLHFIDLRHGWIAGSRTLYAGPGCNTEVFETADGGRSWKEQLRRYFQCSPSVDFVNAQDGWVLTQPDINRYCAMGGCGGSFLYRTSDGGRHWTDLGRASGGINGFEQGVVFATPRVGWLPAAGLAGPGEGGINVTRDGGRTWSRYLRQYDVRGATTVSLLTASDGWLIGCSRRSTGTFCDTVWHTDNGGQHWRRSITG